VLDSQQPHLAQLDSVPDLRSWNDALVALQGSGGNVGGCPLGSMAGGLSDSSHDAGVASAERNPPCALPRRPGRAWSRSAAA
jgi:hypothetical protein